MKRKAIIGWAILFLMTASLSLPAQGIAQVSMADYTATPPFAVNTSVPPNVLLVLDNSGSMNRVAFDYAGNLNAFDPNTVYSGLFDPLECYTYGSQKFDPNPAPNPATPGTCGITEWSGNLMNFATMRRIDIVKLVMMGGTCSVGGRDAMGNCSQLIAQQNFANGAFAADQTQGVSRALAINRIPVAQLPVVGENVYFHMMGDTAALSGGFCLDNDVNPPPSSKCDTGTTAGLGGVNETADGYLETQWTLRIDHFQNSSGVMQEVGNKARFGLMEFRDDSGDGGQILSGVGDNIQSMITGIEATTPQTWTPLAESLYEATRYIAQISPAYVNSNFTVAGVNQDPYFFKAPQWASTSQFVPCCKTYVIIFTDGQPTQDANIPGASITDPNGTPGDSSDDVVVCPVGTGEICDYAHAIHGNHCTGAGCAGHQEDYPSLGSHFLDDVAYWAHTTDLRQGTIPGINETGKDLAGEQNVTVYTFFAFGTGSKILQDTAKAGGFQDRNGNNIPDPGEWDEVNNLTGAAVPDGVPDTYFESSDAFQLKSRLLAAITSILQRSTSGSSVSVLASSSTGEGALYQSFFFPATFEGAKKVTWTGYTAGLFLDAFGNLREDTNGDHRLIYRDDHIITSRFDSSNNEVLIDRFEDIDEDGKADSVTPTTTATMKQVKGIWEAGNQLAIKSSCTRNILTWVDLNGNGLVDGGEQIPLESNCGAKGLDMTATLAPYLRADPTPGAVFSSKNIINFIRGDQVSGMRDRELTVGGSLKVWKLGDSIYAQPIVVGAPTQRFDVIYGDNSYTAYFNQYRNRRQVAYVGANDGMLHAFNAGFFHRGDDPATTASTQVEHGYFTTNPNDNLGGKPLGDELWGFVPQELLPHLQWLADPNYTHVYYVDLTPKVTDVRIFTPDADHPNGWGTILMGGFRFGGSCGNCAAGTGAPPMTVTGDFDNNAGTPDTTRSFYSAYFVMDITNPEKDPVLLWSYSSSDLGLTTTVPSMLRVLPDSSTNIISNADAKWYMVFGSGPTGYDGISSQSGKTFAIDLKLGPASLTTMTTEASNPPSLDGAFMGNTLTIDRDFDYRVDVTYMGSTLDYGSTPWGGKLYRLTTECPTVPCGVSTWGISDGVGRTASELLYTFPTTNSLELGSISTTPAVAIDDANQLWVFAGSGRYYDDLDQTNTDVQYFVGVKDSVLNGTCVDSTKNGCHDNDLINMSNATVCLLGTGTCGTTGNEQVQNVSGADTFPALIALVASKDGWYTTLPNLGERALSRPRVFSGIVFFPTFAPTNDLCTVAGESRLYALFYKTGSAYSTPVIGTSGAGTETIKRSTSMGQGLATEAVIHVGKGGQHSKFGIFSQNSLGQVTRVGSTGTGSVTSRFLSWFDDRG